MHPAVLTDLQRRALSAYNGDVVSIERIDGEPSTPAFALYPVQVTMSTGWVVKLGQYGAVLDEHYRADLAADPARLRQHCAEATREPYSDELLTVAHAVADVFPEESPDRQADAIVAATRAWHAAAAARELRELHELTARMRARVERLRAGRAGLAALAWLRQNGAAVVAENEAGYPLPYGRSHGPITRADALRDARRDFRDALRAADAATTNDDEIAALRDAIDVADVFVYGAWDAPAEDTEAVLPSRDERAWCDA